MLIELTIGDACGAGFEYVADTMSGMLRDCISYTGDVDTVATIALAAGSCSTEVEQNLPPHLLSELENDAFGRDYLETLDGRLMVTRKDT